jgi:hypothetical protein
MAINFQKILLKIFNTSQNLSSFMDLLSLWAQRGEGKDSENQWNILFVQKFSYTDK